MPLSERETRRIVPGAGRTPNSVMLVGEAPGREEAFRGRPFVGKAGREQDSYLGRHGLNSRFFYCTNVVKEYRDGNPDPTPEQLDEWSPVLADEIASCRPKVVIAVGRFAARWFLGDVDMEAVHGLVLRSPKVDAPVVPVYHPAFGFYDNSARALIDFDYSRAAEVVRLSKRGVEPEYVEDELEGCVNYWDLSGQEIEDYMEPRPDVIAVDTEGSPSNPWSIQVSAAPGDGMVLRCSRPDFLAGIRAIQSAADEGTMVVLHNAMYDLEMCRAMGLDLFNSTIIDTMYVAYLLRVEPQGLKPLSFRWSGMLMDDYQEVVGGVGESLQIGYLSEILDLDLPSPEPTIIHENDGRVRLYKAQHIHRRVRKILDDYHSGKVDKDGNPVDLYKRWYKIDQVIRRPVEERIGNMPIGTLADIPLDDAIRYSARDADATFRNWGPLKDELDRLDLFQLALDGGEIAHVFEQMQSTGMPASRRYFEQLAEDMDEEKAKLQSRISHRYYGGKPFNPGSPKQVGALLRRRGLQPGKRTATGAISTSKPSIEHFRYTDEAIADVFDWREHDHIKSAFCQPVLDLIPEDQDIYEVRGRIKYTRTTSRRISMADPNLLNIPVRERIGSRKGLATRVREGYQCPDGEVFGAWDLSQIEMRFLAHESRDELFCRLFIERRDIHGETAQRLFGIGESQTKDVTYRVPAKTTGFGIAYGQGPHGLYTQLRSLGLEDWDVERCEEMISEWLAIYPGVGRYIEGVKRSIRRDGYVRDHWGMYRYLPGINSDDSSVAAEAGRMGVNHRIQGGAQGMLQKSMLWLRPRIRELQDRGYNVKWALQIHDEVIFRFDESLWEVMDELVIEALTKHCGIKLVVPVEAEGHMSRTWGGLK